MEEGGGSATPEQSCCQIRGPLATGDFLLSYPGMIPTTGTGTRRSSVSSAIIPDSGGAAETVGVFEGRRYQLGLRESRSGFQFQPWFNMAAGPEGYFATEPGAVRRVAWRRAGQSGLVPRGLLYAAAMVLSTFGCESTTTDVGPHNLLTDGTSFRLQRVQMSSGEGLLVRIPVQLARWR